MNVEGLYERCYIVYYKEGDEAIYRTPISYKANVNDIYHTIKYNETLHDIARKYYGSSYLWFLIADVNQVITDIFDLVPGTTILIPNQMIINSSYAQLD